MEQIGANHHALGTHPISLSFTKRVPSVLLPPLMGIPPSAFDAHDGSSDIPGAGWHPLEPHVDTGRPDGKDPLTPVSTVRKTLLGTVTVISGLDATNGSRAI